MTLRNAPGFLEREVKKNRGGVILADCTCIILSVLWPYKEDEFPIAPKLMADICGKVFALTIRVLMENDA